MNTKTKKFITMFIISLILAMPFSISVFAQEPEPLAEEQLASEGTGPEINAEIPRYVNSDRIDISGTTDIETTVYLYINGAKQRKYETQNSTAFSFNNVELSAFAITILKIETVSSEGNKNEKSFEVSVDKIVPEIRMQPLPSVAQESDIVLKANFSELCSVNITLNQETIAEEQDVMGIEETIALEEGQNILKLSVYDKAGNKAEVSKTISMDTTPPEIANLTPETGAFFYETHPVADIEGDTEPLSTVVLYKEVQDSKGNLKTEKIDSTTADENGNFKFQNLNLRSGQLSVIAEGDGGYISGDVNAEGTYQPQYVRDPDDLEYEARVDTGGEKDLEDISINLVISATDQAGLQTNESVHYTIGTCFSTSMDWNIINMIEYQSPSTLSAERLEEGTELISFVINMTYQGLGENPTIKNVVFEKANCNAENMLNDKRYNYSCKILPQRPTIIRGNEQQTLWYARFDLAKLEGLNELPDNPFAQLGKKFIFPFKVRVTYTHEINRKETSELQQARCMEFAYAVDTSQINAKKVLPDWLRKDGMSAINETIAALNKYIEKIDAVVKVVAISCIVGFALKVITVIYRRWQAWSDYFQDRSIETDDDGDNEKCPEPGSKANPQISMKNLPADTTPLQQGATQADLTNEQLAKRCPSADSAWSSEKKAYSLYRWTCDRFLCKGTPARWTASSDVEEIRQRTASSLLCSSTTSTKGTVLRKPDADTCEKMTKGLYSECWEYKGQYYSVARSSETIETKEQADYWSGKTGLAAQIGDIVLVKASGTGGFSSLTTPDEIVVTKESSNVLVKDKSQTCEQNCKSSAANKKWQTGECMTGDNLKDKILTSPSDPKKSPNTPWDFNRDVSCQTEGQVCICYGNRAEGARPNPPKDEGDSINYGEEGYSTENDWNYRYDKLGYYYDTYKYYKGRDQSACFGMNNILSPGAPYLSPKDFVPALQCICTTQIRARMILIRNILQGLYNCLQQIDKTGKANAGVCKEIFTQYVCRWIYKIISYLMKGCLSMSGIGKDGAISDFLKQGTDSIFGGVQESTDDLMSDYDNAAIENYLGAGEGAVVEKVCLGALTGDWGLSLDDVIDSAYTAPYHTSAAASPASREYLTFNPDNEMSTYEYSMAWMIAAGCNIDSYTVSLVCATDYEINSIDNVGCTTTAKKAAPGGCDCSKLSAGSKLAQDGSATPEQIIYRSTDAISQGTFVDMSENYNAESLYRYDNVKITIYVNDPKIAKDCIPEKNLVGARMGVFYSPIKDQTVSDLVACRFDQSTATFRCDQGGLLWESKGRAWFGNIECDRTLDCSEKIYHVGSPLEFSKFELYTKSKKHCLYVETKNGIGQKIYSSTKTYDSDPTNPNNITYHVDSPNLLNGAISPVHFGSILGGYNFPEQAILHSRRAQDADTVIEEGTYYTYFKDKINPADEIGDEICYGGTTGNIAVDCQDPNSFTPFTSQRVFKIGGMGFRFENPKVPKDSTCSISEPNCKRYSLFITGPKARTDLEDVQEWSIHLELRHAPGDESQGSCAESTVKDIVKYQGEQQIKNIKVRVSSKTAAESMACIPGGDYNNRNDKKCDCDGDNTKGTAPQDGKDCDGTTYQYCYNRVCRKTPVCLPSTRNTQNCDCDLNDVLGDKSNTDCSNKFCWSTGECKTEAQTAATTPAASASNTPQLA